MSRAATMERAARSPAGAARRPTRANARAGAAWTPDLLAAGGKPLPEQVRASLERQLGHDLADVRIHDGADAAALADAAGAAAFVLGSHVFFASGRFDPGTVPGRRLLAHEIAHVVQNRHSGEVATGAAVGCREVEADSIADQLAERIAEPTGGRPTRPADPTGSARDAAPAPAVELPALRYTDAVSRGTTGTVQVVELVVRMIARTLRTDPEDRSGRVRAQLARLAPELRENVIRQARATLPASDFARLESVLEHADPGGAVLSTPAVGADPDDVAAADPAATATPEAAPQAAAATPAHTHADGTTHAHDHSPDEHSSDGGHAHDHGGGTGLFGRIAAALFGGSPLFTALGQHGTPPGPGASSGATDSTLTPAATTAPTVAPTAAGSTPAAGTQPAQGAPGQVSDAPISSEDEQLAEGRPAPLAGPARDAPAGRQPDGGQQGAPPATAEAPGATRISDPAAAQAEVSAAAGAGPAVGAPAAAPAGGASAAAQGPGAQPDSGGTAAAAPSAEQQRIEDEDRTVLETHANEQEAQAAAGDQGEPSAGGGPEEVAEEAGAPAEVEPTGPEPTAPPEAEPAASQQATEPPTAAAPPEAAVPGPEAAAVEAPEVQAPEAGGPEVGAAEVEGPEAEAAQGPGAESPEAATADGAAGAEEPGAQAGPEAGPEAAPGAEGAGGMAACLSGGAASQPPAPDPDAPSAACGGGSAPAGAAAPAAAVPDVSASTPNAALAAVGAMPATDMAQAIPQVGAATTADVSTQREQMPPPTMERPSGASAALDVAAPIPRRPATPYTGPVDPDRVDAPPGQPTPQPNLQPTPSPSAQQVAVATPRVGGEQQLSEAEAARVTESIDSVPTTDPELAVDSGDPGTVALEADADPTLVVQQRRALGTQVSTVAADGARDAAAPLGEAHIRPHVPPQTLTAAPAADACPGLSGGNRAVAGAGGRYPKVAVDAIVAEKSSGDLQAGVARAGTDFQAARDKKETDTTQARGDSDRQMTDAVQQSNTEQVTLRRGAIAQSTTLRGQWTAEQHTAVDTAVDSSDTAARTGTNDVARVKREHEATAQGHIDDGNQQIRGAREEAERKARVKKEEARHEKHGILGWIDSKIASFFEGLKAAITGFFDAARSLVRRAIDGAKRLAHEAIELGRRAVVGAIKLAGDVIVAAGDVVLAAFPETRARFRERVAAVVDTATQKVNEAADALERGIQALLDALGKALDCALQYLQAGYLAAVDLLASVVKAALEAAQQFLDTLAEWIAIIADIAGDPMGWLRSLGRAAVDGVRNCLWSALKRSIKQWFNDKVEEVVGVGRLIMNVLLRGCLSFADIARMAWDGIKAALPSMVIQLIVEKLVSLLIPAAAALGLLIEGLKAAWGAASRILAAFQKFMAFLKAVKSGNGAGAFADLVAAAAVAVIDFIANFLIGRLKGAGQGVGNTLRGMAQRIGRTLGRAGRAIGRGVRALGRGLVRGARAGAGLVRRGAAAVVRGGRRVIGAVVSGARRVGAMVPRGVVRAARSVARAVDPRRLARAIARSRLGRAVGRGVNRARDWGARQRDRLKAKYDAWRERRRQRAQQSTEDRLRRAVAVIQPALTTLIDRGVSMARLLLNRAYWWARFRASVVALESGGESEFEVRVNPKQKVARAYKLTAARLLEAIDKVVPRLLARRDVRRASSRMERDIAAGRPARITGGAAGIPAAVNAMRSQSLRDAAAPRNIHWLVGRGSDAQRVTEFRPPNYRSSGERMVHSIPGPYTPKDKGGRALDRWLSNAAGGRSSRDQRSARALQRMFRIESAAVPPGQEGNFARTTMLLAGRESGGRSLRNLGLAPLTVDLVARGDMTWRQALNRPGYWARPRAGELHDLRTGGGFPMSFFDAGASAAYREGDQSTRDRLVGKHLPKLTPADHAQREAELQAGSAELERRELALARRWLRAQNAADGGMRFHDAAQAEIWVYERLLKTYGLTRDLDAAAGVGRR
jgi:Domain of unknown function (DUF4157)